MVNSSDDSRERGSTLVECMVAAVVLAALAMGFGASDRARDLAVRHAFEQTVASRVLQSTVEEQRETGRAPAASREVPVADPVLTDARITCRATELEPGLHEATWTLTWRAAGSGPRRRRSLTTRLCTDELVQIPWLDPEAPR